MYVVVLCEEEMRTTKFFINFLKIKNKIKAFDSGEIGRKEEKIEWKKSTSA
jgi:hypothetical protein